MKNICFSICNLVKLDLNIYYLIRLSILCKTCVAEKTLRISEDKYHSFTLHRMADLTPVSE